jgi:hypothetical protein
MTIPFNAPAESPRPKDVGILAIETYFPRRVRLLLVAVVSVVDRPVVHL